MRSHYIDISIPLSPEMLVFPGDPQPELHFSQSGEWTVGEYRGGLHAGTHLDAPRHIFPGGKQLHEMALDTFVGPCLVVDLQHPEGSVTAGDLEALALPEAVERLLIKTRNSRREYWHEPWDAAAIALDLSAAEWCCARRMRLIGIDYLSVERAGESAVHRALLGSEIAVLEGLYLGGVPAGQYELIAAPVKLAGTEAAGCRALLRQGG